MEVRTTPEVETLFSKYEKFGQQFDYRSIAKLYGNKVVAAGPRGVTIHSNNLITRWIFAKGMREFYEKAELTSMRIVHLEENRISNQYSCVNVDWAAAFHKSSTQALEFHMTYIVRKLRNKAEIVMYIAHEDEKKVLEGYGIIN